jgi:hypothetical protein
VANTSTDTIKQKCALAAGFLKNNPQSNSGRLMLFLAKNGFPEGLDPKYVAIAREASVKDVTEIQGHVNRAVAAARSRIKRRASVTVDAPHLKNAEDEAVKEFARWAHANGCTNLKVEVASGPKGRVEVSVRRIPA